MPSHRDRPILHSSLLAELRLANRTTAFSNYTKIHFYNGIRTGNNEIFVISSDIRRRLITEDESSAALLKPYLRARYVKRWHFESSGLWLIYVPWRFSSTKLPSYQKDINKDRADNNLKINYPAIYSYLNKFIENSEIRNTNYTSERKKPKQLENFLDLNNSKYENSKIIVNRLTKDPAFAYDGSGHYNDDSTFSIIGADFFSLSLLNSRFAKWYFTNMCSTLNDYIRISPADVANFPIPLPSKHEESWCAFLAKALTHLYSTDSISEVIDHPLSLMTAYYEQWLNGLVYELFFPEELHRHSIYLFKECSYITYLDLDELTSDEKNARLSSLFQRTYNIQHPLRAMLFALPSLDIVQLIEEKNEN